ncbi:MAG TPA: hypothetical protein PKA41_10885 [Verrucomicrobiota bacterium]|nr:hypothetical protein [Verrucomicrobiota bacterium]
MKTILLACVASAFLLAGCGSKSESPKDTSSSGSPLTAPVDYLDAVGKAQQKAVKTVDVATLTQAIQMFQVQEDRNPKDLNELVQMKYIAKIPEAPYGSKIVYDAKTGTVKVVKQ